MDEQGIHAAILYPGHVLNLEFEFADDVDAIYVDACAYNRWIHAEVGYAHAGRMFLPPYVSLADVELAVEELERVIGEGGTPGRGDHRSRARRPRESARLVARSPIRSSTSSGRASTRRACASSPMRADRLRQVRRRFHQDTEGAARLRRLQWALFWATGRRWTRSRR